MYTIVASKRFRKQVRKLQKSHPPLLKKLEEVIELLRIGNTLSVVYKDHRLTGRLSVYRECHIAPDWLLIYKRHENILVLELFSTGSHSSLFE